MLDLNQAWTALRDVGMTLVVIVAAVIVIEVFTWLIFVKWRKSRLSLPIMLVTPDRKRLFYLDLTNSVVASPCAKAGSLNASIRKGRIVAGPSTVIRSRPSARRRRILCPTRSSTVTTTWRCRVSSMPTATAQ